MIHFRNVSLRATKGTVLKNIDLTIEPDECICITGKSGSGKSLLLSMLRGDVKPTSGKITVDNMDLAKLSPTLLQLYRKNLGILLQDDQLLSDRSIASNVALGLEARNVSMDILAKRTMDLLEMVGLTEKAAMLPEALTHGEQRCAALAQALAHEPMILLADEPVADLDEESRNRILSLLKMAHDLGTTIIITTRNPQMLSGLSVRTMHLSEGMFEGAQKHATKKSLSPIMG